MPQSIGIVSSHISLPNLNITPDRLYYMPGDTVTWTVTTVDSRITNTNLSCTYEYPYSNSTGLWSSNPPTNVLITNGTGTIQGTLESVVPSNIQDVSKQVIAKVWPKQSVPITRLALSYGSVDSMSYRVTSRGRDGSVGYIPLDGLKDDGRCYKFEFYVTANTSSQCYVTLRIDGIKVIDNFRVYSNPATNSDRISYYARINPGSLVEWSWGCYPNGGTVNFYVMPEDDATFALTNPNN